MKLLLLNREEELVSIISETTSDPIYDEVLNGKDTFEYEVAEYSVKKGYRVLFQDINSDWREYIVVGIEEIHNRNGLRKKIYCESSYYELLGDWLADIRPNNRTARYALEQALSTSRWEVGIVDDLGLNSTNYYRTDAKTAVEKVAEIWGGEIKTRIEVIGNKITGRFIDLYQNRGTDKGKRFTYTKDIEEVTREVSEDLIITALHGFGKSEEIGDGFGRRIDFSSINNGKSYLENNSARLMYGRNNSDGTKSHVFGKVEFDDIEDIGLLKLETQKALDTLSIPSVLYKVQVQDLSVFGYEHEKVNLGDDVLIVDKEFVPELRFKARVVGIKRNLANELETEITIGNVLESYTSKMNSQSNALNDIRDRIGVLDKIADGSYSLPRADGQGYNYYGSAAPSNPHNGDVWFKPNGEFQEMWQYVDGQWTLLIDTSVPDHLKKEVKAAQAKAESAKQAAENAYTNAVAEAGNLVEAETTRVDAIIETVNADILNVKNNADSALASIDTAVANAGFTSLDATLADIASTGNQAKADASTALSQAQSAVAVVGDVSGRITTVENSVDDINGVLVNKVSTVDFNNLTGRVGIAETAITQHDSAISLRATKTELTTAIDGIQVGGRNLYLDSGKRFASSAYSLATYNFAIKPIAGEKYTLSIKGKINPEHHTGFYTNIFNGTSHPIMAIVGPEDLGSDGVYRKTFTMPHLADYISTILYSYPLGKYVEASVEWIKLEKGNKATDWTPAPEDVDASIATVQSNLTVEAGKISAVTARVGVTESSIASVKQTADGNSATVANHTGQISTINQTVNGLQSTVANKADKSQITQLENSITSIVSKGTNILKNGDFTRDFSDWTVNLPTAEVVTLVAGERVAKLPPGSTGIYTTDTANTPADYYTFTVRAKTDAYTTTSLHIGFLNLPGTVFNTIFPLSANWQTFSFTTKDVAIGNTFFHAYSRTGNTGNIYIDWITLQRGSYASDSQITQLSNLINLRVTKGDVMSQINIEAGRTLISSNKLLLDANTYIMGTTFANDVKAKSLEAVNANIASIRTSILTSDVITSSMVATSTALITKIFATDATVTTLTGKTAFINSVKAVTIAADKITSGTLNAANVNIINLNVSKLTGNISNFVQTAWNTINSTVSITGDGIVSSNSAGRFVHYTNGGLVFGGGGERTVLRNNTGANPNRSGISLETVGSSLNAIDLDIATRGTSSFHMGISDLDQGYRLRLSNDDFNTNNYYISLKTGSRFDFRLNSNSASGTNKNNLEIELTDTAGSIRVGKNAGYGASMWLVGDDVIFAKGGTSNRVPVYASLFAGKAFNYIEGNNVYSVQKTISAILGWIGSAVTWQTA